MSTQDDSAKFITTEHGTTEHAVANTDQAKETAKVTVVDHLSHASVSRIDPEAPTKHTTASRDEIWNLKIGAKIGR
ncbi:MAG: hypothetical protein ABJZ55_15955 [Fuerstiella sp.]